MRRVLLMAALALTACTVTPRTPVIGVDGTHFTASNVSPGVYHRMVIVISGPAGVVPSVGHCDATVDNVTACHLGDVPRTDADYPAPAMDGTSAATLITATWRNDDGTLGKDVWPR